MWDAALSTMWGIGRFRHLVDFFSAAQRLGLQQFELNHQVSTHMLNGIDLSHYHIDSIHEPCPADISTATLKARDWLISSPDEECRQQGICAIERAIDLAQELGASVIVIHLGRVNVDPQIEKELWDLFEAGQAQTSKYDEAKERLIAARAERVAANLDAVQRSLVELADYAGRAGVQLGVENRYHYLDIPLLDEMDMLLQRLDEERVGFWYDVGHAQTLDNLGFDSHEEWLRRYAPRMFGVHLHDVEGLKDHRAAGLGEVDWDMVATYIPNDAIRACEFRDHNTPEQVAAAMQFLADRGCVKRTGERANERMDE